MPALEALKERMQEISRLGEAAAVLGWDQQTYMPPGAAAARAEQLATLSKLIHQKFTSDEIGKLLDAAIEETKGLDYDSDDASLLRMIKREYDRQTKEPTELVEEETRVTTLAHEEWVKARKNNDYKSFKPWLEKIFDLKRRLAEARGYEENIYDALLDPFEPGAKTAEVAATFDQLRPSLVKLVQEIQASPVQVDASILTRKYDKQKQIEVTNDIVRKIGFDFEHGRQDQAAHPFCTSFSATDVRITTRFDENYLPGSLFASMHEAGHAMYEQGFPSRFEGSPLRNGASLGFHESQSRLWENQVGRSRAFIQFYFPTLQKTFPESLGDVDAEQFFAAANKVRPSLIRVEADEVTYNLHIMLRFELEQEILNGKLRFEDLPEAWNTKMEEYLGIRPDSDANGVLQDVHWSAGIAGYFPTYAIGNLIAAQLWETIQTEMPDIYAQIEKGEFANLLSWLRKNVHQHGCKFTPGELIVKVTGKPLDATAYLRYLRSKFSDIYRLGKS